VRQVQQLSIYYGYHSERVVSTIATDMVTIDILSPAFMPASSLLSTRLHRAISCLCRTSVLCAFICIAAGNITNSLLMKFGFEDQPQHAYKHATLLEMMNGTAAKPFAYRSTIAKLDAIASKKIIEKWPSFPHSAEIEHMHNVYFSDLSDSAWTPELATAYSLLYFVIVVSTAVGLTFVWGLARYRGLSQVSSISFMVAFSFIFPLFFQRSCLFYDFLEFAGVFGAVYFFIKERMIVGTAWIVLFAFVKETFFLVPLGLVFLSKDRSSLKKQACWIALQVALCMFVRHTIMQGYDHNPGDIVEFHLWENIAFWLSPKYWLDLNNLVGPAIFLPRLENPLLLIPIAYFGRMAWNHSESRWKRYFLAAFLPLLALFIPFGFADMFRNFSLAFPAMTLIALSLAYPKL